MFDLGWSEMAVIMLVALVVIGPKDLPRMARTIGQWVAKGRAMAREFQRSLEEMAREAELDDVKREIEKVGRTNIGKSIEKTIDPSGELKKAFDPGADDKSAKAAEGKPAANGQAAEPAPKPGGQGEAAKSASSEAASAATGPAKPKSATKPRASSTAKTSAKPKAAAKPRSTAAKAAAKPRSTASRARATTGRKTAAPRSAGTKSSGAATKTPTETVKSETVAEPS